MLHENERNRFKRKEIYTIQRFITEIYLYAVLYMYTYTSAITGVFFALEQRVWRSLSFPDVARFGANLVC